MVSPVRIANSNTLYCASCLTAAGVSDEHATLDIPMTDVCNWFRGFVPLLAQRIAPAATTPAASATSQSPPTPVRQQSPNVLPDTTTTTTTTITATSTPGGNSTATPPSKAKRIFFFSFFRYFFTKLFSLKRIRSTSYVTTTASSTCA